MSRVLLAAALVGSAALTASTPRASTYAAFSDFDVLAGNTAGAGVWGTDLPLLPAECTAAGFVPTNWFVITEEGSFWSDGVAELVPLGPGIPGSTQDGAFHGTDENDFIVNLGPRRTLHGLAGDDCIVAGEEPDILHGGDGNDVLIGGKKQHSGETLLQATSSPLAEEPPDEELAVTDDSQPAEAPATADESAPVDDVETTDAAETLDSVTTDDSTTSDGTEVVEEPATVEVSAEPTEEPAADETAPLEDVSDDDTLDTDEVGYLDGEGGADVCYPGPLDVAVNCEAGEQG